MVAWRDSGQDEWRFPWLRALFDRLRAAVRPERPRRIDFEVEPNRRDAAGKR